MEIWKDIKGYEGFYQISNKGRVKSLSRYRNNHQGQQEVKEKILKPFISNGYYRVTLRNDGHGKKYYIHRIVASEFLNLRDYSDKYQVDHIDNNRLNNDVENLQIITQAENIKKQMLNMLNNFDKYKENNVKTIIKSYERACNV
jgi:hypothetical protein